jgi:hypothetical protein
LAKTFGQRCNGVVTNQTIWFMDHRSGAGAEDSRDFRTFCELDKISKDNARINCNKSNLKIAAAATRLLIEVEPLPKGKAVTPLLHRVTEVGRQFLKAADCGGYCQAAGCCAETSDGSVRARSRSYGKQSPDRPPKR